MVVAEEQSMTEYDKLNVFSQICQGVSKDDKA